MPRLFIYAGRHTNVTEPLKRLVSANPAQFCSIFNCPAFGRVTPIYIENVLVYTGIALAKNPREGMYAASTVTLNRDEMEHRRLQAAEELLGGATQARVARKFGVSRTTASRWYRILEKQGVDRLRKRKAPGRPSRLSEAQMSAVREMFAAGPRAFGFDSDRWTTARLATAIETHLGVRYDPDHVGRLMHRLGLRTKRVSEPPMGTAPTAFSSAPNVVEMHI